MLVCIMQLGVPELTRGLSCREEMVWMRSRKAASQRGDLGAAGPLPLSSVAMRSRNSTASLSDSAAAVVLCQHLFTQHHDGSEYDLILLV